MGKEIYFDDEKYLDMATAVSGSGPAYFFQLAESLLEAAGHIGEANYETGLEVLEEVQTSKRFPDEIGILQSVFKAMVNKVYQREQSLRRTVEELKIQIDESKRKKQVDEIVDSDFFQSLQEKAARMREQQKTIKRDDKPEEE